MIRFNRACFVTLAGVALFAGDVQGPRHQAWVLVLDSKGNVVPDLKANEFQVKVAGADCPVVKLQNPGETGTMAQSWILVFEPIRDMRFRAQAFAAASDFLSQLPEGDRALVIVRSPAEFQSLMPGLTAKRADWAQAMRQVPDLVPEKLMGSPDPAIKGKGFDPAYTAASDGVPGQNAILVVMKAFQADKADKGTLSKGTMEQRGMGAIQRLNFADPTGVSTQVKAIGMDVKGLEAIMQALASIPGQKHMIVFSRNEMDDMTNPAIKRSGGDDIRNPTRDVMGGGNIGSAYQAETASKASGEMIVYQSSLKAKALASGVTLYSVAGQGQDFKGNVGFIAAATGGFGFTFGPNMGIQFAQGIQAFGSRYLLDWSESGDAKSGASLSITTTRKGLKVIAQTER